MKGLPNYGNYCFLNTAIQQLYAIKDFREKIMAVDISTPNSPVCLDTNTYRPLISIKKLFEYLYGRRSAGPREIELWMKDLGYRENQEDSVEARDALLKKIKTLLKKLKGKTLSPTSLGNIINVNFQAGTGIEDFIESSCCETVETGKILTVNLKDKSMILNIGRPAESRLYNISRKLDLTKLVDDGILQILYRGEPVFDPQFTIKSVAIYIPNSLWGKNKDLGNGFELGLEIHSIESTGGHYFTINHSGPNRWTIFNDEHVKDNRKWNDVKKYALYATSVIYEFQDH